jgi:hypothetical protein
MHAVARFVRPSISSFLALASLTCAVACGGVVDPVSSSAGVSSESTTSIVKDDASATQTVTSSESITDAGVDAPTSNLPPRCSVAISGAITTSWSNSDTTASLEVGYPSSQNQMTLTCWFDAGDITYELVPDLAGITGPGTYEATDVTLHRICNVDSCPGAWDFGTLAGAGRETCTFVVDRFAPATRGGMSAHFTCASLPIEAYEYTSDTASIAITGSIDLPAVAPDAPAVTYDAGFYEPPDPAIADGGAPTCTMSVTGEYDASSTSGSGFVMVGDPDSSVTDLLECAITVNGVSYDFSAVLGDGGMQETGLGLSGASWCTAGCTIDYGPSAPCTIAVTENQGVGGSFVGSVSCGPLFVQGAGDAGAAAEVRVTASINAQVSPLPEPK